MEAPAETRGWVLFTARTAVRCLRDPQITAWTTERAGLDRFDQAAFVASGQTLYLLSKDGGGRLDRRCSPSWTRPLTILQSYGRGQAVWGRPGMRTLWRAAVGPRKDGRFKPREDRRSQRETAGGCRRGAAGRHARRER